MSDSTPTVHVDVLIFGGGITGLWTLARLRREGYSCVLLESKALGSGQTIASQGIIHGGIKYALTGKASAASKAIAEMPGIWRACLEGRGEVDLREAKVLSPNQYLWTTGGLASRIAGAVASKVIRTSVQSIPQKDRQPWMLSAPRTVDFYAVDEPVLDPRSVLQSLSAPHRTVILRPATCERGYPELISESGYLVGAHVSRRQWGHASVRSRATILCAGGGNAALLNSQSRTVPVAQVRPLHMLMARAQSYRAPLPHIYGHCLGASDKPRVTITTGFDAAHQPVWYIGGEIAERGAGTSRQQLIDAARQELPECLPWLDLQGLQFAALKVDRAEGFAGGDRPDHPVVRRFGRTIAVWPTKLAFAPLVASQVADELRLMDITPSSPSADDEVASLGSRDVDVALLPWDESGVLWT